MRDVNGDWHVTGNVTLNDHSVVGRPLNQLTSEELAAEQDFRRERVRVERKPRLRLMAVLGVIAALLLCAVGVLVMVQGEVSVAAVIVAVAAVLIGAAGVKFTASPWSFEQEHVDACREIRRLQRLRGN